jgi:hypothetical protein
MKNDRIKNDRIKSDHIKSDRIKTDRIKRITDPPPSLHCHFSPKQRPFWNLPRPHTINIHFHAFLGRSAINWY